MPSGATAPRDAPTRRTQAGLTDVPPLPSGALPVGAAALEGARSISLEAALYGTLTSNPDLVTLRSSNLASPEAVEVARRFPTTLNPTIWIDLRPITLIPRDTFVSGSTSGSGGNRGPFYHFGDVYLNISLRQPVELGHQTTHRYEIAQAALNQQQWTVVQAEMLALVQAYRFFETAAYRREKLRLARQLADFNDRLLQTLRRGLEAAQVPAADVALAEVENEATRQLVEVARQDYAVALTDLRNQIGVPETAATAEPLGEFVLPPFLPSADEQGMVQMALQSRPEIHAARALAAGAAAAVRLAKGDRIPSPVIGPQYAIDEAGIQYIGLILVSPLPILNNGTPLVRQREADYHRALVTVQQAEQRAVAQVKAATAKWNNAGRLVERTSGLDQTLRPQVARLERLFEANQATLAQLLQARQRLIQLENARIDAIWQATQAQADLLLALGAPSLLTALERTAPGPRPGASPDNAAVPPPPPASR